MIARLAMAYFAGAVAALFASLALWAIGQAGLTQAFGSRLAPPLAWDWLSPRLLWGSLFALGYPLVRRRGFSPVRTGLVLSLIPTLSELLVIQPARANGFFGLSLGTSTPFFVLISNMLWGWMLARIMIGKGRA